MNRYLVLFARDPGREARDKGLGAPGEDLFATFAAGWRAAAWRAGATFVLATPREDFSAWRAHLGADDPDILWIAQRGQSFGERLEGVVRATAAWPGHAVLVGGDVAPTGDALEKAFEALELGAEAVLAPARDGGVSLLALSEEDSDLLATLAPRQRGVSETLRRRLSARGRRVTFVEPASDVDGRRGLRSLSREPRLTRSLRCLVFRILESLILRRGEAFVPARARVLANPWGLRAPPISL